MLVSSVSSPLILISNDDDEGEDSIVNPKTE